MISFIDTNVLVYMFDASDARKQALAIARFERAVADEQVVLSTQVLNEFFSIVTRKLNPAMPRSEAAAHVQRLCRFQVMDSTAASIQNALSVQQQHQLSWWDALIVEAALRAKADCLISEDLSAGRQFGGLRVENPFV